MTSSLSNLISIVKDFEKMLPWNCNRNIVTIKDKMFILGKDGLIYQLYFGKLYKRDIDLDKAVIGTCLRLEHIPPTIEYITKSDIRNELIGISSYPHCKIYLIDIPDSSERTEELTFDYSVRTYAIFESLSSFKQLHYPLVLTLSRSQFLILECELPQD